MPSGYIIVLIVALWAAVLVPALLRRHDEATESKSVDRFVRAMRTLRRDEPLPAGDHTVLMPRRPAAAIAPQIFRKGEHRPARVSAAVSAAGPAAGSGRRPAPSLVVRRRRALFALVLAVALTVILGVAAGGLFWALHGLADGIVVVYVAHLRAEAKRARAMRMRRQAPVRARSWASASEAFAAAVWAGDAERAVSVEEPAATEVPAAAEGNPRAWQPIPVPPPTYVTAPTAPRRGKQIEVPPAWADGLREEDAEVVAGLERLEPEIERLVERRRAVND